MKKPATAEEKAFMKAVKQLPCIICGHAPISEFHHITKYGRRLGHMFGLPLCVECHRGNDGFSGINRSAWDKSLENQLGLLEKVKCDMCSTGAKVGAGDFNRREV